MGRLYVDNGCLMSQNIQLGFTQILVSASVNVLIILSAAKLANWFHARPTYKNRVCWPRKNVPLRLTWVFMSWLLEQGYWRDMNKDPRLISDNRLSV